MGETTIYGTSTLSLAYAAIIILKIVRVEPMKTWPWVYVCIPLMVGGGLLALLCCFGCCAIYSIKNEVDDDNNESKTSDQNTDEELGLPDFTSKINKLKNMQKLAMAQEV